MDSTQSLPSITTFNLLVICQLLSIFFPSVPTESQARGTNKSHWSLEEATCITHIASLDYLVSIVKPHGKSSGEASGTWESSCEEVHDVAPDLLDVTGSELPISILVKSLQKQ